ncbi:MAG: formyltransferase family protein [Porphyromonadaceae bacterium]|nr:formyltransferase family protein [Porphyromonadaceae bacterium]
MNNNNYKVAFYLLGYKGYIVLQRFLTAFSKNNISCVVIGKDKNVCNDFSLEIEELCQSNKLTFYFRNDSFDVAADTIFLIGWRWMIDIGDKKIIVLHDSLLPKYRGFNPLVTALINKEERIGVTALFANNKYDRGDIIAQKSISVSYPLKISKAIELITPLYSDLVNEISQKLFADIPLNAVPQVEEKATYSVWRDKDDYRINWQESACRIALFVDATGFPYEGAQTEAYGEIVEIIGAEALEYDIMVENRTPGKVIFVEEGYPIVICGKGLLKITQMVSKRDKTSLLPLKQFRTRFS